MSDRVSLAPRASPRLDVVVHATHEAGLKVGGIGAVLDGLLSTQAYNSAVARTILVGPLDAQDTVEMERLLAQRNQLQVHYSSHLGVDQVDAELSARLRAIEIQYRVTLLYGTRTFGLSRHEVILVDATRTVRKTVNAYKGNLYRDYGIQSDRYEGHPEYDRFVNAAEPSYDALQAIVGQAGPKRLIVAHEFMGLPLCYSAAMRDGDVYSLIFYGHEVATVRSIVELHPGHDTMFYNVLRQAHDQGLYLKQVFGDQSSFFKHALIRPVPSCCDNIFAVGDLVAQEMRFLDAEWNRAHIDLVYNGVPSFQINLDAKERSRALLRQYAHNLFSYRPDHIFTHVTRFVPSKGLWRDLRVMEHLDTILEQQGRTAVLIILSTVLPLGRPAKAVHEMERLYGWPVTHRETSLRVEGQDVPDLFSHEISFYRAIEWFNQKAQASRIILVNQYGWSRERCGKRMPEEMSFADLRQGSDLEFGQSIYEPFGIAQLEPLSFGGLCVVSSVCGCLGFVRRVGGDDVPNLIIADYTDLSEPGLPERAADPPGFGEVLSIDRAQRNRVESAQARIAADEIARRLPHDEAAFQELLSEGYALSQEMSWDVVARDFLLPGLQRACDCRQQVSRLSTQRRQ